MKKKEDSPEGKNEKRNPEDLPYNPEVTKEDRQALNQKGRSMNKGQDKDLDRERPVNFTGKNMDVSGSNSAKPTNDGSIPDEENQQYNKQGARNEQEKGKDHPNSDKKI